MRKINKYLFRSVSTVIATTPLIFAISCGDRVNLNKNDPMGILNGLNLAANQSITNDINIADVEYKDTVLINGFQIPFNVKNIGNNAFENATLVPWLEIPINSSLGDNVFKNVILPDWYEWSSKNTNDEPIPGSILRPIIEIKDYDYDNVTIPLEFNIPSSVIIENDAFNDAKLQPGFQIPNYFKDYNAVKFKKAIKPPNYEWSVTDVNGYPIAGSKIIPDKISFSILNNIDSNVISNTTLPFDYVMKSDVNIENGAFNNTILSPEFQIPPNANFAFDTFDNSKMPSNFYEWSKTENISGRPIAGSKVIPNITYFQKLTQITSNMLSNIILPSGYTFDLTSNNIITIKSNAFENTTLVEGFKLPKNVIIEENSFKDANLVPGFQIPSSAHLNDHAFDNAKIGSNYEWSDVGPNGKPIPGSKIIPTQKYLLTLRTIYKNEFSNTKLKTGFKLPDKISIKKDAFKNTTLIPGFQIPPSAIVVTDAFDNCNMPSGGYDWSDSNGAVPGSKVIPDLTHFKSLINIESNVFSNITLPNNYIFDLSNTKKINIEKDAFENTTLYLGFQIPHNAFIEKDAFAGYVMPNGCKWSFTDVNGDPLPGSKVIPNKWNFESLQYINSNVISNTFLPSDYVMKSDVIIESDAFKDTIISWGFQIPSKATIKDHAFDNSNLPGLGYKWSDVDNNGNPLPGSKVIPDLNTFWTLDDIKANMFSNITLPNNYFFNLANTKPINIQKNAFENTTLIPGFQIPFNANIERDAFNNYNMPINHRWSMTDNNGNPLPGSKVIPDLNNFLYLDKIDANVISNTLIPAGYSIVKSTTIEKDAFKNTILAPGFSYPGLWFPAKHFNDSIIPLGYEWSSTNPSGEPIAGSIIVPIKTFATFQYADQKLIDSYTIPQSINEIGANAFLGTGFVWKMPTGNQKYKLSQEGILDYKNSNAVLTNINDVTLWDGVEKVETNTFVHADLKINNFNPNIDPIIFEDYAFAKSGLIWKITDKNTNKFHLTQDKVDIKSDPNLSNKKVELVNSSDISLLKDPNLEKITSKAFEGIHLDPGLEGINLGNNLVVEKNAFLGTGYVWKIPDTNIIGKYQLNQNGVSLSTTPQAQLLRVSNITNIWNDISFINKHILIGTGYVWKTPISQLDSNHYRLTHDSYISNINAPWNPVPQLLYMDDPTLTKDVKVIGEEAFAYLDLSSLITISKEVEEIGKHAFFDTKLHSTFYIPNTVGKVVQDAFKQTRLPKDYMWSKTKNSQPIPGERLIKINI
ncbi:MAG: leucine-rich repeat domain-containing protein [Mollicutes bacterium PWAP]|nr:leucine-rich repeat domain-containing protein [Mollicutes bacterium PWAP]